MFAEDVHNCTTVQLYSVMMMTTCLQLDRLVHVFCDNDHDQGTKQAGKKDLIRAE